jgi:fatty acid desaturase
LEGEGIDLKSGRRVEWPTVAVAVAVYGGLFVTVWSWRALGAFSLLPLAFLSCWHSSLQHECLHGHPTRVRWINTAIAGLPVGLAFPYCRYSETHRQHHVNANITDPALDPESFYVSPEAWSAMSRWHRRYLVASRAMVGRLVLGPPYMVLRFWNGEIRSRRVLMAIRHVLGIGAVLAGVRSLGMPLWAYALGAAYGGYSLTVLRSFTEHRYVETGTRSAVNDAGVLWRVLYLNNTLHHTHHEHPDLAWYRLPAMHRSGQYADEAAVGAGRYRGFAHIARRYAFRPFDTPVRVTADIVESPRAA